MHRMTFFTFESRKELKDASIKIIKILDYISLNLLTEPLKIVSSTEGIIRVLT